jgi:hypothetical protein
MPRRASPRAIMSRRKCPGNFSLLQERKISVLMARCDLLPVVGMGTKDQWGEHERKPNVKWYDTVRGLGKLSIHASWRSGLRPQVRNDFRIYKNRSQRIVTSAHDGRFAVLVKACGNDDRAGTGSFRHNHRQLCGPYLRSVAR